MSYWKPATIMIYATLLLIVAALTIGSGYPIGTSSGMQDNPSSESPPRFVNLGEFLINLNGGDGQQYLKTSISLKLGEAAHEDKVEANIPKIRHHVNLILQDMPASELYTNEGKLRLSEQIKQHAEHVMGFGNRPPTPDAGQANTKISAVSDVLFTSFIIQR